jgi:uncharacterized protein (DUF488 family)
MGPLFTVGHSTRTLDELVRICEAANVGGIADVRRFPGSRRSPHFARQALETSLPARGIDYLWLGALGGHRRRAADAPPSPWHVPAFAAYADHMHTAEFRDGFARLLAAATDRPTAIMCAEASPYRCHRRLISDWAELHGIEIVHLLDEHRRERHKVTPFARHAADGGVVYEADPQLALPLG